MFEVAVFWCILGSLSIYHFFQFYFIYLKNVLLQCAHNKPRIPRTVRLCDIVPAWRTFDPFQRLRNQSFIFLSMPSKLENQAVHSCVLYGPWRPYMVRMFQQRKRTSETLLWEQEETSEQGRWAQLNSDVLPCGAASFFFQAASLLRHNETQLDYERHLTCVEIAVRVPKCSWSRAWKTGSWFIMHNHVYP